jgi:putative transposase
MQASWGSPTTPRSMDGGESETNGCAERWIRTLKEQCLWVELHDTIEERRQAVSGFVERYNTWWLIQRQGHQTPKEAYRTAQATASA